MITLKTAIAALVIAAGACETYTFTNVDNS